MVAIQEIYTDTMYYVIFMERQQVIDNIRHYVWTYMDIRIAANIEDNIYNQVWNQIWLGIIEHE